MDAQVVVVGAGCIGASVAMHLAEAGHDVLVLEKEAVPALHQSGRNSGVIHPGYHVPPGSAKARYCVQGSRAMRAYCRARGVPVEEGGIVVVAVRQREEPLLRELERRGRANGVRVGIVDEAGLADLEPHAVGVAALHAPEGASVDARAYVQALVADAEAAGARFHYGAQVHHVEAAGSGPVTLHTPLGPVRAQVLVNAAGLHADRLAGPLAHDVRVVPFRGAYATLAPAAARLVRSHIYPVPDPAFPFLGVHLSRRVDGSVTAGPTAAPAAGREAYTLRDASLRDLGANAAWPGAWRLGLRPAFLARVPGEAARAASVRAVWRAARRIVPALQARDLARAPGLTGIRAQLVDRRGRLVEDLLVRETARAVHVLNAVSPGLTCSLPFGDDIAARAATKL